MYTATFDNQLIEMSAGTEFAVAAGSNMVSGAMFNCFDVARVRLQIQDGLGHAGHYRGLPQTLAKIVREEGVLGPWRPGLGAAIFRELFYGGFQFGAYGPIKTALGTVLGSSSSTGGQDSMLHKLVASCCSGASASLLGCPTDVIKTRLQCESGRICFGKLKGQRRKRLKLMRCFGSGYSGQQGDL